MCIHICIYIYIYTHIRIIVIIVIIWSSGRSKSTACLSYALGGVKLSLTTRQICSPRPALALHPDSIRNRNGTDYSFVTPLSKVVL